MKKSKQIAKDKKREKEEKRIMKIEKAPVAMSQTQRFPSRGGRRSWRFTGSELIGDVRGSTAFSTTRYPINPGLERSFPWLSGEADKWEQYKFHSLRYRYVPRCATTTVGSILMSPDYNVRDNPPTTELQAADTYGAVESSAWVGTTCALDVAAMFPFGPRKMIRQSFVAGELNLYDAANFYMSTTGMTGADLVGKLWVDYDVEFFIPQNSPDDRLAPSYSSFFTFGNLVLPSPNPAPVSATVPFGSVYDPLRIGVVAGQPGVFTIFRPPYPGIYQVSFSCEFALTDIDAPPQGRFALSLYKNGLTVIYTLNPTVYVGQFTTALAVGSFTYLVSANGVNDYFSVVAQADYNSNTASAVLTGGSLIFSIA